MILTIVILAMLYTRRFREEVARDGGDDNYDGNDDDDGDDNQSIWFLTTSRLMTMVGMLVVMATLNLHP